ncbi:MAG: hypothetical protein HDR17_09795 [Lachnospiraceae bacterium]|nr:hypothetical protein [Lachnospiraceae bacterium]
MKKKKKIIIRLLISAAGILAVVIALLGFRLRGSVAIRAGQTVRAPQDVVAYRQDDERWAGDTLGDSSFTMKSSGCLVSCIASAISMESRDEVTPGELNRIFTEHSVYDGEGNIQWAAVDRIDGYSTHVYQGVSQQEIDQCLAAGHYPIVRVRVNGVGNFHYVLIVGTENEDYVCMDPLKSELTELSQYLGRVYAVRMVQSDG